MSVTRHDLNQEQARHAETRRARDEALSKVETLSSRLSDAQEALKAAHAKIGGLERSIKSEQSRLAVAQAEAVGSGKQAAEIAALKSKLLAAESGAEALASDMARAEKSAAKLRAENIKMAALQKKIEREQARLERLAPEIKEVTIKVPHYTADLDLVSADDLRAALEAKGGNK